MKKKTAAKLIIIPAALGAAVAAFNKMIFLLAEKGKEPSDKEFYETPFGSVAYEESGTGKPLLLVHGMEIGSSGQEWEKNKGELSRNYTVYTIDLLGFGESEKPSISYSAYTFAVIINGFIKDIIGKKTAAVGSGHAGAALVKAAKLEPKNFAKLVLVSPNGIVFEKADKNANHFKTLIDSSFIGTTIYNVKASKQGIRKLLKEKMLFSDEKITEDIISSRYVNSHIGGENNKYTFSSFEAKYMDADIKEDLGKLNIPVLLVYGDDRQEEIEREEEEAKKAAPNAFLAVFEETKLLPHYENPLGFNKVVKKFLG
ncbi:MAG: alpha/beta fold hydrolase [Lachnospiraceae bacterium]|nr:alpha/beta fold hydrolase [Lachnospiraceae bacterium]